MDYEDDDDDEEEEEEEEKIGRTDGQTQPLLEMRECIKKFLSCHVDMSCCVVVPSNIKSLCHTILIIVVLVIFYLSLSF